MEPPPSMEERLREVEAAQGRLRRQLAELDEQIRLLRGGDEPPALPEALTASPEPSPPAAASVEDVPEAIVLPPLPVTPEEPRESLELHLGRVWFVRIGVVLVLTGLVFLGNFLYRTYFMPHGPLGKVLLLTALGGALTGVGGWLMRWREDMRQYGRVVLAGGLAALYYTGYAAHFVERLRVIESPLVAGGLLLAMAAGLVWLAERLRAQSLAVAVVLLSFYTSAINPVHGFALFSNLLLGGVAAWFLVRHAWVTISWAGLLGSYAAFAFWRLHQHGGLVFGTGLEPHEFWLSRGFLLTYWALFTLAAFTGGGRRMPPEMRATFLSVNQLAFTAFVLPALHRIAPEGVWIFSASLGAVQIWLHRLSARLVPADAVTPAALLAQGLALVTFALAWKLEGDTLTLALALESTVLVVLAQKARLGRAIFATAAVGALAVSVNLLAEPGLREGPSRTAVCLWSAGIHAVTAWLARFLARRRALRRVHGWAVPWAVAMVFAGLLALGAQGLWATGSLPLAALTCAVVAMLALSLRWTRALEVALAARVWLGPAMILFVSGAPHPAERSFDFDQRVLAAAVLLGTAASWWIGLRRDRRSPFRWVAALDFLLALVCLHLWIRDTAPVRWYAGEHAIVAGFIFLAVRGLPAHWLVWPALMIAPGVVALGWNLLAFESTWHSAWVPAVLLLAGWKMRPEAKPTVGQGAFVLGAALAFGLANDLAPAAWRTVVWTGVGIGLFALGFVWKERLVRLCGLAAVGLALVRIFARDVWRLETGGRIVSFLVLGSGLLVLGFFYNRFRDRLREWL